MRIALAIPLALLPALAAGQIPVLSVTPSALVFVAGTGQGQSVPQRVHVGNRGSGTLRWRATADAGWVRVSPASGTGAADLTVTADLARLQAGKHEARIRIEAADADDSPATVTVTAQVGVAHAAAPPHAATKTQLTATAGAKAPATWTFQLDGPGDAPTAWRLSSDAPWLTADPAAGTTPTRVTIKADASRLAAGGYQGSVQFFNAAGEPLLIVPVFFTVDAAPVNTAATARPTASTAATTGQPAPLTIDAQALPPATRNLPYSQALPVRGGTPPYVMRVVQGRLPVGLALSNGALTGMTRFPGTYQFTVAVTDSATPAAMVTQAMTLRVIILQTDTALSVDPPAMSLLAAGVQRVQRGRISVGSWRRHLYWKATSDASWLGLVVAAGVSPGVVELEANATGLAPGTYVATVTIEMEGAPNSPARIPVQLTVRK
jgi:hypothetical protein